MLDSKIQSLKRHFGITVASDWCGVKPEWILSQDGIGPVTLDYIRLCLAVRGLTLKDDRTPEYWKQHLQTAKISHVMGNEEDFDADADGVVIDRGILCPFTILVDTAEQSPFTFQGLRADADQEHRPLIVPVEYRAIGRFPDSLGDYSLDSTVGGVGRCHVERKSMEDAHGTILGFKKGPDGGPSRRERFEKELANLSEMEAAAVVVECEFCTLVANVPVYGVKTKAENAKTLHRSVLSWQQRFPKVAWLFCADRRWAERTTFQWLEMWYRRQVDERKEMEREEKRKRKEVEKWRQMEMEEVTL